MPTTTHNNRPQAVQVAASRAAARDRVVANGQAMRRAIPARPLEDSEPELWPALVEALAQAD